MLSQRYERGSTIVTSNLPFEDWTSVLASERLTGALLDRLTHHVHILTMNGDSYRLKQSAGRRRPATPADRALCHVAPLSPKWPGFTPPQWPGIAPPLTADWTPGKGASSGSTVRVSR